MAHKNQYRFILFWLFGTCFLIWGMIMLGGATRLTHSGLSIVEWKPISGIIPPLTEQAWVAEFAKYQTFPEYQQVNYGMNLSEFKFIFWMEFAHRLLGRFMGLFFLLPMLVLWGRGLLSASLKRVSLVALSLGAMQGAMGWYMVKSGLVKDPAVSHYRLTAHLLLAVFLLLILFWAGLKQAQPRQQTDAPRNLRLTLHVAATFVLLTIIYGGFVAGLKAGHIYNTYPLMGGQFLPSEWAFHQPLYLNFIENAATVQWVHRTIAVITLSVVILVAFMIRGAHVAVHTKRAAAVMIGVTLLQVGLGILTLLHHVPVSLGTVHQGTAMMVMVMVIYLMYQLKYQPQKG